MINGSRGDPDHRSLGDGAETGKTGTNTNRKNDMVDTCERKGMCGW